MKWLNNLTEKNGIIGKITDVVGQSVTDKDAKNELIYKISIILMNSKIAPYIRAVLSIITVVSILFFADKLTIEKDTQQYILYTIYGFYFLDYLTSSFKK